MQSKQAGSQKPKILFLLDSKVRYSIGIFFNVFHLYQRQTTFHQRYLDENRNDSYGSAARLLSEAAVSLPVLGSSLFGSGTSGGDDKNSKKKATIFNFEFIHDWLKCMIFIFMHSCFRSAFPKSFQMQFSFHVGTEAHSQGSETFT